MRTIENYVRHEWACRRTKLGTVQMAPCELREKYLESKMEEFAFNWKENNCQE